MFDELLEANEPGADKDRDFQMLQELEQNTPDELRRQRAHFRVEVKAKIFVSPANSSEMNKWSLQGTTGDLSSGGCRVLLPMPIMVGDVYRLSFEQSQIDLPLTFVRCMRCCMLQEGRFEVGFRFFSLIHLPDKLRGVPQMTRK